MKLIHLTTTTHALMFLKGQAAFMRSQGLDVHVVSSPGPELNEFRKSEQVTTHQVTMTRSISPFRDLVAILKLVRLFLREKPQIVHTHTPKASLLGVLAASIARVPCRIFHIHGLPHCTASGFSRTLLRCSTWIPCLFATRVICVSKSVALMSIEEGLCRPEKMAVFGQGSINGVDATGRFCPTKGVRPLRQQILKVHETDLVIGFVGRLALDKGVRELYRAWLTIREEFPHAYLAIAGSVDERDPAPKDVIDSLKADERVRMLGWTTDTASVYGSLDVLVLPSFREGFPSVILESAAMGVPAITTRATGCVDSVIDGVTGMLVDAHDPLALTDALRAYLKNPRLREQHGRQARERVLAEFRPADIWQSTLKAYQSAVNRPFPSPVVHASSKVIR